MNIRVKNKLYYALLSGLHPTLPKAELRAILEAEKYRYYRVVAELDQLVIYELDRSSRGIARRSGLIHETGRVLAISDAEEGELLKSIESIEWDGILDSDDRVRVELRRLRGYAEKQLPHEAEYRVAKKLDTILPSCCRARVTPRNPTKYLRIIVTEGVAIIGLREDIQPKKLLSQHKPRSRPFYYPGSLDPKIGRLFVNLSRASVGRIYLDPFCGTGGFAVEAKTMGIESICGEIVYKLTRGAKINIEAYRGPPADVIQWDADSIPLRDESIDSIGTDPPYGRSVSTRGRSTAKLLEEFLIEAERILRKKGYIATALPHWIDHENLLDKTSELKYIEIHYMKVHRSLTRKILVVKKK